MTLSGGQQVTHATFGMGVVIEVKEQSVVVIFGDGEVRQIANEYLTAGVCTESVQNGSDAVDALIGQIKEHRQRMRPHRLFEGGMLCALRQACKESGKRDFTKIITDDLGYARQTAYDLIREYRDAAARFATAKTEVESSGDDDKQSAEPQYEAADADDVLTPEPDAQADKISKLIESEQGKRKGRKPEHHPTEVQPPRLKGLDPDAVQDYWAYYEAHAGQVRQMYLAVYQKVVALQRAAEAEDAKAEEEHYQATDEDLPASLRVVIPPPTDAPVYPASAEGA